MNIVGGSEGFGILISEVVNGNFTWKARCSCGLTTTASWEIPINQDLVDAAANGFVSSKEIVSYNAKYENVYGYDVSSDDPMIATNKSSVILSKNDSVKLTATIVGNSSKTTWKSSNPSVAIVDSKGKVTGKKAGTTTITAKANGKTASCKVTVKKPTIKLNKSKATIYTSGTLELKATVKGSNSKVAWTSSNEKIAKVSSKGKVTAKKTGTVKIVA